MKNLLLSLSLVLLVGCASQSRVVYNTLAAVETTTVGAYNAYLDLVVKGNLTTNSVPVVSKDFNIFQTSWTAAVMVAQWNTNTVAPQAVVDLSTTVLTDINLVEGLK